MLVRWLVCSSIVATFTVLAVSPVGADQFVYVSLDGESRISAHRLNDQGQLAALPNTPIESPAGAMAVSPDGRYLYVSLRQAGRLASFQIDASSGGLTHLGTIPAGEDPAFVATDNTGEYLLTAYYVDAKVCVHRLKDGRINAIPLQTIPTAKNAHAILTSNDNRSVFVPHTSPNAIYQFRFDPAQGKLRANNPPVVNTGDRTGPRQLAFHPKLNVVYFDYEQGSAIAAFTLDPATGLLRFRERLSTLPDSFDGSRNSNARIEMTRDGRFVYVANRGHDSLAGFAVAPDDGKLSPLGQFATEPTPRGFAIDATSRYLIAAGQSSGKLAIFRIAGHSGKLSPIGRQNVGDRPWWVTITSGPAT